jgi:hypothetical protein
MGRSIEHVSAATASLARASNSLMIGRHCGVPFFTFEARAIIATSLSNDAQSNRCPHQ